MSVGSPMVGSLQVKWDPKNLEIRTMSVEKTLEPLVTQVRGIKRRKWSLGLLVFFQLDDILKNL